jgi:hypothetical protein
MSTAALLVDSSLKPFGTQGNPLVVEQSSGTLESIQSLSGTNAAAGDKIIVAGVAGKRIKVFAISIFAPTATTAVTLNLTDGIGGAILWSTLVQAPNQSAFAFATTVSLPTFLFATSAGNGLNMNLSAATVTITANASYWIE